LALRFLTISEAIISNPTHSSRCTILVLNTDVHAWQELLRTALLELANSGSLLRQAAVASGAGSGLPKTKLV